MEDKLLSIADISDVIVQHPISKYDVYFSMNVLPVTATIMFRVYTHKRKEMVKYDLMFQLTGGVQVGHTTLKGFLDEAFVKFEKEMACPEVQN